jgi:hypothetical protein
MALRDLGFDQLQERVYRALLAEPAHDLASLAAAVSAPKEDVPKVIAALVELSVARFDPVAPAGVVLGNPSVALGELIERAEDGLLRRYRQVGDTRAELAALAALHAGGPAKPGDGNGVERVDSLEKVRERLEELSFFTRTSVFSVQPGGPQSAASLAASRPLDLRGLRRGIDMRLIHEAAVLDDEANRAYLRELAAAGATVRVSDTLQERLVIMDEQVAIVPVDPRSSGRGALVVQQQGLLAGFVALFHRLWDEATDVAWGGAEAEPEPDLTQEDRRVLALLASGSTDEAAARTVGVSVRHLRRRVARLMERLGAASRFEAGAEAARRGWI